MDKLTEIKALVGRITTEVLGVTFKIEVHEDKIHGGRLYLQVTYTAPCSKTGNAEEWKSGKNYLSEFMTPDEVIKKAYVTFEQAVKHEVMEGFKVDNIILFNPHTNFEDLLKVSSKEITRE